MITLFIDTSSSDVSIALIRDEKILSSITKCIPNKHSIYTVSFIDEVLKNTSLESTDINSIMVVTGPGSFTGVRIGVTIAKTFAYLSNCNIIEVSSLKMLALSTNHEFCLSLIDAKHDNYYLGLYDKDNNVVIEEQFNNKEYILKLIDEYRPIVISNEDIVIDDIKVKRQDLNYINICNYYKDKEVKNPHFVVPNYLKLPQALEEKR